MAVRTALFRLFLATILVLNGIASAMAAVHHAAGPIGPGESIEAILVDAGPHGSCDVPDPLLAGTDSQSAHGAQGTGHSPEPDCCESGTCHGTCVNTGVPALQSEMLGGFGNPGQAGARPTATWHAAPAPPHLMRPPIS